MTYGELRYELSKALGSVDLDLLDGWIRDRYMRILDALDWHRKTVVGTFQTEAEYSTGTVNVTHGSSVLSITDGEWTEESSGKVIRIANRPEFYGFWFSTGSGGSLDRGYEGETDPAATYRMNRNVYQFPSDVRSIVSIESFALGRPLERVTLGQLNEIDPRRSQYGRPVRYCLYMDSYTEPPVLQVELHPIPIAVEGYKYTATADEATPSSTSSAILPWVRPAALKAGVQADAARTAGNVGLAEAFEAQYLALVAEMANRESRAKGATPLRPAQYLHGYQTRRWTR